MRYEIKVSDRIFDGVLVETQAEYVEMIQRLGFSRHVVVDLETNGLQPYSGNRLIGIAIYLPEYPSAYYIPFRHGSGDNFPLSYMKPLRRLLTDPDKTYYGWNFKFDLHFLNVDGFPVLERDFDVEDVMIALHLLDENRLVRGQNYKLKDNARIFVDPTAADASDELEAELKAMKLGKGSMYVLPATKVAKYAMLDVILTWEMRQGLFPYLEKWDVVELYHTQNEFLKTVLLRMEANGMLIDPEMIHTKMKETMDKAQALLEEIQQRASGYFPEGINPNSSQQVTAWLGLPNAQKATLEASDDPRAEMILDYKVLSKATGTFYEPYLKWRDSKNRIHPTLHIIGTVSGRLSSSEPNLQQVPRQAKAGKRGYDVKSVFVAPEGYQLVQFDYAQLELRLACYYSGEPTMTRMIIEGQDLHQYTADALNIDRYTGKTANFGLLYGMGAKKAATMFKTTEREAARIVKEWHELYPAFRRAHKDITELMKEWRTPEGVSQGAYQYIRLPDNRVRRLFYGYDEDGNNTDNSFSGWNTLIQGTGAIVMREALLNLVKMFPVSDDRVIPVMTVHDSVIMYIKNEWVLELIPQIIAVMTDFPEYNPPMDVEAQYGTSWGDLKVWNEFKHEGKTYRRVAEDHWLIEIEKVWVRTDYQNERLEALWTQEAERLGA